MARHRPTRRKGTERERETRPHGAYLPAPYLHAYTNEEAPYVRIHRPSLYRLISHLRSRPAGARTLRLSLAIIATPIFGFKGYRGIRGKDEHARRGSSFYRNGKRPERTTARYTPERKRDPAEIVRFYVHTYVGLNRKGKAGSAIENARCLFAFQVVGNTNHGERLQAAINGGRSLNSTD